MKARYSFFDIARYYFCYPSIKIGVILVIAGAIAIGIVGFGYWQPARDDLKNIDALVKLTRKQIMDERHAAEIYAAYIGASDKVNLIENKLNSTAGQTVLVNAIEEFSTKRDLVIISETYDKGKEKNGYQSLYIDLVVQGNYRGLRDFFYDVYSLPAWSFVEEASLHRMQGKNMIQAQLRLVSYHVANKVIHEDAHL